MELHSLQHPFHYERKSTILGSLGTSVIKVVLIGKLNTV